MDNRKYILLISAMAAEPLWSFEAGMMLISDKDLDNILWC